MYDNSYAMSIYSSAYYTYMMYYKKDLLQELGIGKDTTQSWDELLESGKEVYEKSDGSSYGLLIGMNAGWLISDATYQMARAITPETGMNWKTGEYNYA